jgi:hypothetical protein
MDSTARGAHAELIAETGRTVNRSRSHLSSLWASIARAEHAISRSRVLIEEHKASRPEPSQVFVAAAYEMQERRPRLSYEEKLRIARDLIERFRAAGIECELGPVYRIH